MGMKVDKETERKILEQAGLVPVVPPAAEEDEKDFQVRVADLARSLGWDWHHQTVSKMSKAGWPDIALFRERIVFIELKSESGRLDAAQERWRDIIRAAGGEWYCFKPSDWVDLVDVLTNQSAPVRTTNALEMEGY